MAEYTIVVSSEGAGKRLDVSLMEFAVRASLGLSRTALQSLIVTGGVSINGARVSKPSHKVSAGQEIRLSVAEKKPAVLTEENIPLEILYEDSDILVVNKPAGLVVHPAPGNDYHTLVQALMYHTKQLSDINPARPGIVHRLDKETSGVMVVAKNNQAHLDLAKQFAKHTIKRTYVALVKGKVEFDENIIDLPIGRHPEKRHSMAVGFSGNIREARTHYKTVRRTPSWSLLELHPYTGRTHQLRVHLAYLGHPILGDTKYGKDNRFVRMALHAKYLGFIHPRTGTYVEFSSVLPEEFTEFLK